MIEVRMRENHRVDFLGRNRRVLPVSFTPFLLALKQTTINQNLETIFASRVGSSVDQMLGAGNHSRRSQELNVGQDGSSLLQISDHRSISDFRSQILDLFSCL